MGKKQQIIFGIDEVGRGPLAGPVIACAIFVSCFTQFPTPLLRPQAKGWGQFAVWAGRDSKKLTVNQREEIYDLLKKNPEVQWGIGKVSEKMIDKINIFEASKLAMVKAIKNLEKKIKKPANLLLIDGNFKIPIKREQQSIIKGDEKIPLIALASIVAKVERDGLMLKMHKKYPQYGFDKHKGYGTSCHFKMISQFGVCDIHRQSFNIGLGKGK